MNNKKIKRVLHKGFTLLEILLVVAAIAILAAVVIRALNPSKQLADTRNSQRSLDLNTIVNVIYQYEIDNKGALPDTDANGGVLIPVGTYDASDPDNIIDDSVEICRSTSTADCATNGLVDLSPLLENKKYIVAIPNDPSNTDPDGTGYFIVQDSESNRITVIAPNTELEPTTSLLVPLNASL